MDNRWTAVKSKCVYVKLGGNLGAMISTKPEPVNIITLGNPVTVMQIWSKLYQIEPFLWVRENIQRHFKVNGFLREHSFHIQEMISHSL